MAIYDSGTLACNYSTNQKCQVSCIDDFLFISGIECEECEYISAKIISCQITRFVIICSNPRTCRNIIRGTYNCTNSNYLPSLFCSKIVEHFVASFSHCGDDVFLGIFFPRQNSLNCKLYKYFTPLLNCITITHIYLIISGESCHCLAEQ